MKLKLMLILCCNLSSFSTALKFYVHPDVGLSIPQLLRKYGYPVQIHNVITEDNYIITIFRIPHGKNSTKVHKYPVMLVPGTCGCSENFIATGPEYALAFYLSDHGFDVWLTNTRGNRHARKHKTLNPEMNRKFWNFSWHEVAVYDTPALTDYILKVTKASQLFYIGHSQGTTSYFAFAAEKPEYNRKIKLAVQMGPSCLLKDTRSIVTLLGKHYALLENILKFIDLHVLFPKPINDFLNSLTRVMCSEMTFFVDICYLILYFGDYSHNNLVKPEMVQLALQDSPAGCSVKELLHYFQIIHSGVFGQYNYGVRGNLKQYGTKTPPLYNLSYLAAPISLFLAPSDRIVPPKGVRKLAQIIPNLESIYEVPIDTFNHVDFIFSTAAREYVNKPIYELLIKYINKDQN